MIMFLPKKGDKIMESTRTSWNFVWVKDGAGNEFACPVESLKKRSEMTKAEMDAVWCDWMPDDGWPCRACVGTDLAPGDLVEIKLTAAR